MNMEEIKKATTEKDKKIIKLIDELHYRGLKLYKIIADVARVTSLLYESNEYGLSRNVELNGIIDDLVDCLDNKYYKRVFKMCENTFDETVKEMNIYVDYEDYIDWYCDTFERINWDMVDECGPECICGFEEYVQGMLEYCIIKNVDIWDKKYDCKSLSEL